MIYRSNLTCPDLTFAFTHLHSRPMPHSFGHDVPSDWADKADDDPFFGIYKRCGMWTHDEAAILYNVANSAPQGRWVDIGAHTGWTTAHISRAGRHCRGVDPMLAEQEFIYRFGENTFTATGDLVDPYGLTSLEYFATRAPTHGKRSGYCIDGDHQPGKPLEDATNALMFATPRCVMIFHDFIGKPVREAVLYLMNQGFHCRVYKTPHMIGLCWRGHWVPPFHVPDPNLPDLFARCPDFPFERCE